MTYAKVIGIGGTCQTAAQIRDILGQTEAYPFDWLISPLPAMRKAVETRFAGILQPDNLSVDATGLRVVDAVNGLQYQHDFPVDADHITLPGYQDHAAGVLEKYRRRIDRFAAVLNSGEPVLLVRFATHLTEIGDPSRALLAAVFRARYPQANLTFLWCIAEPVEPHTVLEGFVHPVPTQPDWRGTEREWREALAFAGALAPVLI